MCVVLTANRWKLLLQQLTWVSAYQIWVDTFSSGTDPSVPVCQGVN